MAEISYTTSQFWTLGSFIGIRERTSSGKFSGTCGCILVSLETLTEEHSHCKEPVKRISGTFPGKPHFRLLTFLGDFGVPRCPVQFSKVFGCESKINVEDHENLISDHCPPAQSGSRGVNRLKYLIFNSWRWESVDFKFRATVSSTTPERASRSLYNSSLFLNGRWGRCHSSRQEPYFCNVNQLIFNLNLAMRSISPRRSSLNCQIE